MKHVFGVAGIAMLTLLFSCAEADKDKEQEGSTEVYEETLKVQDEVDDLNLEIEDLNDAENELNELENELDNI